MDLIQKLNEISERELTKGETAKKEKIVKSMKKDKAGFEKRYGDDAESVMYATATKMAKNEAPEQQPADAQAAKSLISLYNDPRVKQDPGMRIMTAIRYFDQMGSDIPGFNRAEFSRDQLEMYARTKLSKRRDMSQVGSNRADVRSMMSTMRDAVENVEKTNPKAVTEGGMKDYLHDEAEKLSREEFLKKHGESLAGFYDAINGTEEAVEGGMSDIHIGAQEALADYVDDDGRLKMPKRDVVADLVKRSKEASMPLSYELETAAQMVADKFDDNGEEKYDMEPDMNSLNTNTMENNDKKDVKEEIQMTADTPEEAGMLMQILKMAGIKPMGAEMPDTKPGDEMDPGELNKQMDQTDGDEMAKYMGMIIKPDMEKQEETFANEPEEKTQDVDSLVNVHSGGLNRQKTQYRKEYPGDNPMAVEDKITEEELANSLRAQYEGFKKAYQEAAKPDYIDLDKDGNKTEPMKKAAQDKEAKDKK